MGGRVGNRRAGPQEPVRSPQRDSSSLGPLENGQLVPESQDLHLQRGTVRHDEISPASSDFRTSRMAHNGNSAKRQEQHFQPLRIFWRGHEATKSTTMVFPAGGCDSNPLEPGF